jgi:exonuclease SbcC
MKPLRLTLTSFGPFAGVETVDFCRYGDNSFLLIHGVTGAGKTTILDGICYALYGNASGEKRDEHYLRSQLAARDAICSVEFLFQIGLNRYQIKRQPPQKVEQKGKQRDLLHKVEFCQVDERGQICGECLTKIGEVAAKVEALIGFNSNQFRQVVVLPQGEFRKLLLAKSDDKEEILEKLFGTALYKRVEESLKGRRFAISSNLKELRAAVAGILSTHSVTTPQALQDGLNDIRQQRATLAVMLAEQLLLHKEAQARLQVAQALAQSFAELDLARLEHAALEAEKPRMDRAASQLERAQKAAGLADLDANLVQQTSELKDQKEGLQQLADSIVKLTAERQTTSTRFAQAKADNENIPALTLEIANLRQTLGKIEALATSQDHLAAAVTAEKTARTRLDAAKEGITSREDQQNELNRRIETLALKTGRLGEWQNELAQVSKLLQVRQSFDQNSAALTQLQSRIALAEASCQEAEVRHNLLEQEYTERQQRFIRGQAAFLAQGLMAGQACPVCGSSSHPAPATMADDTPNEPELAQAKQGLVQLRQQLQERRQVWNDLLAQKSGLEGALLQLAATLGPAEKNSPAELTAKQQTLLASCNAAEAELKELDSARVRRAQLALELLAEKQALPAVESHWQAASAAWEQQKAITAKLADEVGGADPLALSGRIEAIERLMESARQTLRQAEADLQAVDGQLASAKGQQEEKRATIPRLEAELARLHGEFGRRLASEGFVDAKDYLAAKLPGPELTQLKAQVDIFREKLTAALARRERAEKGCLGQTRPDLAVVTAAREAIEQRLGDLRMQDGTLAGQQQGVEAALAAIGEKGAKITALEREYAIVGHLADISGGQNPMRMTLQRYVLAALFEEVALAASHRLSRMSRGRYHLVRSEAPRDGKATSGLDLDVIDDYIGEKRPAFTLSGGESFLASLALALGLSDVVMGHCGGRYLDCLFIDEGFGSLDGESLEFALNTLIELHRSGRVVGIISHVLELKERIASRIEVIGGKEGSRIWQQGV